ncbi:MAG: hypothetical protein GY936_08365 [Ignavibacteriae bacterium]|nr:hypothetical protein [Ignavibacteriota bacterium]
MNSNTSLLQYERVIREQADTLLFKKGLYKILEKYGNVLLTGSYSLKLMYKKDLDISLISPNLTVKEFYKMGGRISELINPYSVYYRNTKVKKINGRPDNALYFGFIFNDWKIDLWVVDKERAEGSEIYSNNILKKLTDEKRILILEIKKEYLTNKEYGKVFSSKEVYDAVINKHVKSLKEFKKYIEILRL